MTQNNGHKPMTRGQIEEAVLKASPLITPESRKVWGSIGVHPDLNEERKSSAEWVYENFRFDVPPEGASGWEFESGRNEFHRTIFLPNGDGPSIKGSFGVRFRPDTTTVADVWSLDQNGNTNGTPRPEWYDRRNELEPDQVFTSCDGSLVKLRRRVPGDGTKWYVVNWDGDSWFNEDSTIEPSDLADMVEDPAMNLSAEREVPAP